MRLRGELQRLTAAACAARPPQLRFFQVIQALPAAFRLPDSARSSTLRGLCRPVAGHQPITRGQPCPSSALFPSSSRTASAVISSARSIDRFEKAGLRVVAARMMQLSQRGGGRLLRGASRAAIFQGSGEVHDLRARDGASARGRRARSRRIARSWARPIRRRRRRARFAPISRTASTRTWCTGPTRRTRRLGKLRISSGKLSSARVRASVTLDTIGGH